MEDLKRFFIKLSRDLTYKDAKVVKVNVFKALYWAVSGEGEFFDNLFSGVPEEQQKELRQYQWKLTSKSDRKPFYTNIKSCDYSHPENQICGKPFKEGDPIYRCEECAYDDTCVLCSSCFNKEDHLDHSVSFYYAGSNNGGMCDCGDEAAFVNRLHCACQQSLSLDDKFRKTIHGVLQFAFQYCLDVSNFSISTLPFIHEHLNNNGSATLHTEQLSDLGSLPVDEYGIVDENSGNSWYLVLWNDENHNYDEARTAIRSATGVSNEVAQKIAKLISTSGRAVLKEAKQPHILFTAQKSAEADGLISTIISRRDYAREMIVGSIFAWVCEVTSFGGNSAFREESKKQLADILLRPNFQFSKTLSSQLFRHWGESLREECYNNGLVVDGTLENLAPVYCDQRDRFSLDGCVEDTFKKHDIQRRFNSRLQFLLIFEIRFPLRTRKLLTRIILTLLGGDPRSKAEFAEQYLQIYSQLLIVSALSDREEHQSCMDHIRIQLFTCPITNEGIVCGNHLPRIIVPLCWLIENYAAKFNASSGFLNLVNIVHDLKSKREKSSIQRAISSSINDLTHILGKNRLQDMLSKFVRGDNLYALLTLMKFFSGAFPITRKLGDHISQESLNEAVLFLERAVPIYYIAECATQTDRNHKQLFIEALGTILGLVSSHEEHRKLKPSVLSPHKYRVSSHPVSLINPINSFISFVAQRSPQSVLPKVLRDQKDSIISLAEKSLASIVLASQVRIGLWIRNGFAVSRQASYYSDMSMKEVLHFRQFIPSASIRPLGKLAYHRDLHVVQLAIIGGEASSVFELVVKTWELHEWFFKMSEFQSTVYEEKVDYICEQFVKTLYLLFTDRALFSDATSDDNSSFTIESIAYALCGEPKSFSDLLSELDEEACDMEQFESQLSLCASLQSPTGITDSGVYRLKPFYFEHLDPLSSFLDASQFESFSASLVKNLARIRGVSEDSVLISPRIKKAKNASVNHKILEFFTSTQMAKLIYKLLQEGINSDKEIYISQLLHLLHAIFMDIGASDQKSALFESYIDIPVCDLLLTIAESSMSQAIVIKADHLLSLLIYTDSRIIKSLQDCFGEQHLEAYRSRKAGRSSSSNEKRKGTAEKRKAKILKKLAKQQRSFQAQNMHHQLEDGPDDSSYKPRSRCCVICGEQESSDKQFGILLCSSQNSTFWKVPSFDDEFSALAFSDYDSNLPKNAGATFSRGYPYKEMKEKGYLSVISGTIANSCCHGVHFECFSRQHTRARCFPCSLCHNLHDGFLPSFIPASNAVRERVLMGQFEDPIGQKMYPVEALAKGLIDENYWTGEPSSLARFTDSISRNFRQGYFIDTGGFHNKLQALSRLIANTIQSNEIATRVVGNVAYRTFLALIPAQVKTTVFSLMQLRCYLALFVKQGSFPQLHETEEESPMESSVFTKTVTRIFNGEKNPLQLVHEGFAELILCSIPELIRNIGEGHYSLAIEHAEENSPSSSDASLFINYISREFNCLWGKAKERGHDPKRLSIFVFDALQRVALTYLRQFSIFWDIISGSMLEGNEFESCHSVQVLSSLLGDKEALETIDPLLGFFNLPSLMGFIRQLSAEESTERVELRLGNAVEVNPKFITLLDYPGRVSLVEMPLDYNSCVVDPIHKIKGRKLDTICLSCGTYLDRRRILLHPLECCLMPIFFTPSRKYLTVFIQVAATSVEVQIPVPYLTTHGETERPGVVGKAYLSHQRYAHINQLWLNQEIYGFVTRSLFDGASPRLFRADAQLFNNDVFEGSDSEGDIVVDMNSPVDVFGPEFG